MFRYFLLIPSLVYFSAVSYAADPKKKLGELPAPPASPDKLLDPIKPKAPGLADSAPVDSVPKSAKSNAENKANPGDPLIIPEKIVPKSPPAFSVITNELTFRADLNQAVSLAASEQFNNLVLYLGIFGLVGLITIIASMYFLTRSNDRSSIVQSIAGPTAQDINNLIKVCEGLKQALPGQAKSGTSHHSTDNRNKTHPSLEDAFNKFLPRISAEVVKALQESEGGGLKTRIAEKDAELAWNETEHARLSRQVESLKADLVNAKADTDKALSMIDPTKIQNDRLNVQLTDALKAVDVAHQETDKERLKASELSTENEASALTIRELKADIKRLTDELKVDRTSLDQSRIDLNTRNEVVDRLSDKVRRAYESMAPSKLSGTELAPQIEVVHQEALAGDMSAVSVWSALSSFGAAQLDPAAKDFQLQIIRRLGVVLVQYWKQKALSEKERHEHLSLWAKHLNEHADSRYNLFVPGLGAPIDKTRMVSASSGTTVHEVLCWQIRNPTGANFMLAEVG